MSILTTSIIAAEAMTEIRVSIAYHSEYRTFIFHPPHHLFYFGFDLYFSCAVFLSPFARTMPGRAHEANLLKLLKKSEIGEHGIGEDRGRRFNSMEA